MCVRGQRARAQCSPQWHNLRRGQGWARLQNTLWCFRVLGTNNYTMCEGWVQDDIRWRAKVVGLMNHPSGCGGGGLLGLDGVAGTTIGKKTQEKWYRRDREGWRRDVLFPMVDGGMGRGVRLKFVHEQIEWELSKGYT